MSNYRTAGEGRDPKPRTVEFEIKGDFVAFEGIALFSGADKEGNSLTGISFYGDMKPIEIIGILQTTLDQYRYNYIDRDYNVLEDEEE